MKNSEGRKFSCGERQAVSCGSDGFCKVLAIWGEADVLIFHQEAVKFWFRCGYHLSLLTLPVVVHHMMGTLLGLPGCQSLFHRRLWNDSTTANGKPKLLGTFKCFVWTWNCRNLCPACWIHAHSRSWCYFLYFLLLAFRFNTIMKFQTFNKLRWKQININKSCSLPVLDRWLVEGATGNHKSSVLWL